MKILLLFLIFSSPTFAAYKQFKPIGNAPRFAPPSYSSYANASKSIQGAVSVNGRFAIATMNPKSALALGRQLAKSSPYALLGLAALDFFQDENNDWFAPPVNPALPITASPKSDTETRGTCTYPTAVDASQGECIGITKAAALNGAYGETEFHTAATGFHYVTVDANHSKIRASYTTIPDDVQVEFDIGGFDFPYEIDNKTCPPDGMPEFTRPILGSDGSISNCANGTTYDDHFPQPTNTTKMAEALGDAAYQTNHELWDAFKDSPDDEFLSPESVQSYNQPDVSDTFNDYLKRVASGDYQFTDPEGENYVPSNQVIPTQIAIKAMEKGDPAVDPTTGQVANPKVKTDGAATKPVDPNAVPQNINVTVTVPEDDTISQTEYEQSNETFFQQFDETAQLEKTKIDTAVTTLESADEDFLNSLAEDVTNFTVPDFPTFDSLFPDLPFGNCTGFSLNTSIAGIQRLMVFDKHCQPYNLYIHPLASWFFSLLTGLYVFYLAGETLKSR